MRSSSSLDLRSSSPAVSWRLRSSSSSSFAFMALASFFFDMASLPLSLIFDSNTAMHLVICILVGSGADLPSTAEGWSASSVMRATMFSALRIFFVSTRDAHVRESRRFSANFSAFLGWGVGGFADGLGCWGVVAAVEDDSPTAAVESLVEVDFLLSCCCGVCFTISSEAVFFFVLFVISPGEEYFFSISPRDFALDRGGVLLLG
mmetsp:Transcript_33007/g.71319  ORF Transcript_33007/g.71319 Transcript_33007/m.71319 type:complete len:205 (-) Transcript_33007:63-677(-)